MIAGVVRDANGIVSAGGARQTTAKTEADPFGMTKKDGTLAGGVVARMAYFVGLDSGGTKTDCWVGDETEVLGRAQCGTVKLTRVGQEIATERMRGLLAAAALDAGVDLQTVRRTCVGVAGFAIAEVREWAARVVGGAVAGEVEVCGDDEIALDAAFRGGPGVLVIGGTGSSVMGRCADGARFTCGGWGPGVADEGSGFWIGREAVRQGFRARDRGQETMLVGAVQQAWGVADAGAVVGFANQRPGPDFAALVPAVLACAEAGDAVAGRLLERAGEELAEQVSVVWARMRAHGEQADVVAYAGSILEKIGPVRGAMERALPAGLRLMDGAVNSMDGAMWRARGGLRLAAKSESGDIDRHEL